MDREFILVVVAGLLGSVGAITVVFMGNRLKLEDTPNERSSHSKVTPKGGGIGILVSFFLAAIWLNFPILVWLPAVVLSLISLLGDRIELSPRWRLIAQFVAAGIACSQIARNWPESVLWFGSGVVLAAFFVVATANIFNFMDGINGLAGITGIIAFSLLAWVGWTRCESFTWVLVAAALAAACAGFLPWNFPRARVFMGDVGSILLGFVFAVFVVAWSKTWVDLLVFAMFLLPFYADEFITLIPRLRDKDSLTRPHRRHVYQILVNQMGISHGRISVLYGAIQLVVSGVAIVLRPWGFFAEAFWLGLALALAWLGGAWVRRHECLPREKGATP